MQNNLVKPQLRVFLYEAMLYKKNHIKMLFYIFLFANF